VNKMHGQCGGGGAPSMKSSSVHLQSGMGGMYSSIETDVSNGACNLLPLHKQSHCPIQTLCTATQRLT